MTSGEVIVGNRAHGGILPALAAMLFSIARVARTTPDADAQLPLEAALFDK
jgi:hypothetical protein